MDHLVGIKTFCAVAELGSFAAAARRLGLSSAMASKHVAHLERRLGARLLHRSSRHVSLTEAGTTYFERCRSILDDLDEVEALLGAAAHGPRGRLKLSGPVWLANGSFVDVLADYRLAHPDVHLDIDLSGRMVNLVEEGFDLALRVTPALGDTLIARPIGSVDFDLVAAPAYLQRHGRPSTPMDLTHHRLLTYSLHPIEPKHFGLPAEAGEFTSILQSNNETLLHIASLRSMGLALLPHCLVAADLQSGALEKLLPESVKVKLSLYGVYASRRQLSAKVRSLIDFLTDDPRLR